jgi:hypothetical protein
VPPEKNVCFLPGNLWLKLLHYAGITSVQNCTVLLVRKFQNVVPSGWGPETARNRWRGPAAQAAGGDTVWVGGVGLGGAGCVGAAIRAESVACPQVSKRSSERMGARNRPQSVAGAGGTSCRGGYGLGGWGGAGLSWVCGGGHTGRKRRLSASFKT